MNRHYARPAKLTGRWRVPSALGGGGVGGAWRPLRPRLGPRGRPAVAHHVQGFFTALKNAVAVGGTIDYGVSCSSSPVSFTATIKVPAGLTADVEANGHSVTFDGGNKVRLFQVTGGKLTIGGISLNNAAVLTASGTNGGTGADGTPGTSGSNGANGTAGDVPGQARTAIPARRAARVARPPRARPAVRERTPRWPEGRRC